MSAVNIVLNPTAEEVITEFAVAEALALEPAIHRAVIARLDWIARAIDGYTELKNVFVKRAL
jgi:hypothetical protein